MGVRMPVLRKFCACFAPPGRPLRCRASLGRHPDFVERLCLALGPRQRTLQKWRVRVLAFAAGGYGWQRLEVQVQGVGVGLVHGLERAERHDGADR